MSILSILLISISLAMDAFAVSLSAGFTVKKVLIRQAFLLAFTFGLFQAVMPAIGWLGGITISSYIEPIDHWISFFLLSAIGVNMIRESISNDEDDEKRDYFSLKSLMTLGVATSIDALAIGISFALLPVDILLAISIIGIVTFFSCFTGVYLGGKYGHIFGNKAEILGGCILIVIGTKILLGHL